MWRDARFIAGRDLAIMLRTRETILWTFVMPVVFFYFMGTVTADFGGSDPGDPDPIALRGAGGGAFSSPRSPGDSKSSTLRCTTPPPHGSSPTIPGA